MENVLTAEEVRAAEERVMQSGVTEDYLRLNAALAIADGIFTRAKAEGAYTAVFCGNGGNGYDGLLAACRLKRLGINVRAFLTADKSKYDAKLIAYAENAGLEMLPAAEYCFNATVIVDAIFGIGLNREVTGVVAELIKDLNSQKRGFRLAVDIPSGLNADTGEIMGVAFDADITVTFSCYKRGMLFGKGKDVCGKVIVEQIGIDTQSVVRVFGSADLPRSKRKRTAHKGNNGKIFVIGGSGAMIGAPMLAGAAAHAAYLNGAGTVTVCLPAIHRASASARANMAMMKYLPDTPEGFIKFDKKSLKEIIRKATAINIGTGMGATPELKNIVEYLCENFDGVLVLDADALNAVASDHAFLKDAKAKIIITPHVGEFTRLTGKPATVENAMEFAKQTGVLTVLKSDTTIITDGTEARLNITGTPAMAKGGTGDVLGGCIAALACAYGAFDAACIACYRNGIGAEYAVSSYAELMLTPRDILNYAEYKELF